MIINKNSDNYKGRNYRVIGDGKKDRKHPPNTVIALQYNKSRNIQPDEVAFALNQEWLIIDDSSANNRVIEDYESFEGAAKVFYNFTGDKPPKPVWLDDADADI